MSITACLGIMLDSHDVHWYSIASAHRVLCPLGGKRRERYSWVRWDHQFDTGIGVLQSPAWMNATHSFSIPNDELNANQHYILNVQCVIELFYKQVSILWIVSLAWCNTSKWDYGHASSLEWISFGTPAICSVSPTVFVSHYLSTKMLQVKIY